MRWALLVAALSLNCVGVQRPSTITVEGDGSLGWVAYTQQGCEGEHREELHRQLGGSVAARVERANGFVGGARLRLLADRVTEAEPDEGREGAVDLLYAFGAYAGFDGAHVGADLGVTVVHSPGLRALVVPALRLRAGDLAAIWGEVGAGGDDPLLAVPVLSAGAAFREGRFRGRAGVGSTTRLLTFAGEGAREPTTIAMAVGEAYSIFGYVEAQYRGETGPGVLLGGVLGPYPALRLGFSWTFAAD
ncbi:MAG: hypothetical protein H6701_08285 [Myxococcales bacterium]|nr:hypothetical protein [Myxococcales bacterium]